MMGNLNNYDGLTQMVCPQNNKARKHRKQNVLIRYQKERYKNTLATPGENELILVLDHLKAGYNVPKIFRSAEAFGVHEIHLINIGPFDPAPAKGAYRKVPAHEHESFSTCYDLLKQRGYTLFGLEAGGNTIIYNAPLPEKSAFIMGNEGLGHSFERNDYPDIQYLSIPHTGATESLNVSIAASIVMYEYIRQHAAKPD
ncbi:MAG: TrmH family RNA methyltransferase [Gammaproteobacteria bacterium]|nr:TrmH family RNA methyltransferase [Gammaproteobacteria bacterium]